MHNHEIDPSQAAGAAVDLIKATRTTTSQPMEARPHPAPPPEPAEKPARVAEDPVVATIRNDLTDPNLRVGFFMVEGNSQPVIRIYNQQTGEVIRQIPEEAVLRLRERFAEMLGVMADRKA